MNITELLSELLSELLELRRGGPHNARVIIKYNFSQ